LTIIEPQLDQVEEAPLHGVAQGRLARVVGLVDVQVQLVLQEAGDGQRGVLARGQVQQGGAVPRRQQRVCTLLRGQPELLGRVDLRDQIVDEAQPVLGLPVEVGRDLEQEGQELSAIPDRSPLYRPRPGLGVRDGK